MQTLYYNWLHGYKYKLADDFIIELSFKPDRDILAEKVQFFASGHLVICKGFMWDGASGPTIDDKSNMRAALIHDALYYLMRKGLLSKEQYRDDADRELREICKTDGMWWFRARLWLRALRLFAENAAKAHDGDEEQDRIITIEYQDYNP